jgi:hypothetical protein
VDLRPQHFSLPFFQLSPWPTLPAVRLRSSSVKPLTWCAWALVALFAQRAFCAKLIRLRAVADLQEIVDLDAAPDPSFDTGAVDAGVRLAE